MLLLLVYGALAAPPVVHTPAGVHTQARAGVTYASLVASRDPVEIGKFTHDKAEWLVKCWALEPKGTGLGCAVSNGETRHVATSVGYIGETEKNLSLRFPGNAWGGGTEFKVVVGGVAAR
ncbi:MAG: hypothetical protein V4850_24985 [Myxococcota bacterium]